MFVVGLTLSGAVPGSEALGKREWNRILRAEFEEVGHRWGREYRPRHFTDEGARMYGYIKRKGEGMTQGSRAQRRSYTGRKLREKGHTLPLVWEGKSRDASARYRLYPTKSGVRISMPTPRLNLRHPKSQIRMADELRKVTPREKEELARFMEARLGRRLRSITKKSTKQF